MTDPTSTAVPQSGRRLGVLIAVAVVVIAGLLVWLLWPSGGSGPTVLDSAAGSYTVQLTVDNPRMGGNTVDLNVTDEHGRPAVGKTVTVNAVMPQMGHAIPPVPTTSDSPGHYRAATVMLSMTGQWEIAVVISGVGQAVFPVLVNG